MIASDARTHRPECEMAVTNGMSQVGSMQWDGTTFWLTDAGQVAAIPQKPCVCERIKRAEKRVGNVISASLVGGYDWRQGYLAGLDAAREAVAALEVPSDWVGSTRQGLDNALAAIDALKEKP